MKRFIGEKHPDVFSFIRKIKNEQTVQEAKMEQSLTGTPPPNKRIKYIDEEAKLLNVVRMFAEMNRIDYLRAIANLINN